MKKLIMLMTACALLAVAGVSHAEGKIAVYDLQRAVVSTKVVQQKLKDLEASAGFAELKAEYDAIVADLQKLDQEQKTNGMTWSEDQAAEHRKKREYRRADLELATKKLQDVQASSINALVQDLARKASTEVIPALIKSEGIGLVLRAEAVAHADTSYDITSKITDRLDNAK